MSSYDGIGAAYFALTSNGVSVARYYSMEIDADCRAVVRQMAPNVIDLGDADDWDAQSLIQRLAADGASDKDIVVMCAGPPPVPGL